MAKIWHTRSPPRSDSQVFGVLTVQESTLWACGTQFITHKLAALKRLLDIRWLPFAHDCSDRRTVLLVVPRQITLIRMIVMMKRIARLLSQWKSPSPRHWIWRELLACWANGSGSNPRWRTQQWLRWWHTYRLNSIRYTYSIEKYPVHVHVAHRTIILTKKWMDFPSKVSALMFVLRKGLKPVVSCKNINFVSRK